MSDNIDPTITNYILRTEYESRHAELNAKIDRVATDYKNDLNEIKSSIKELDNQISTLSSVLNKGRISVWQFISITLANFIFTGGLVGWLIVTGHVR